MPTNYAVQVYDKLWTLLEASSDFTTTVKAGNRIKFRTSTAGENPYPIKQVLADADTPQVSILPPSVNWSTWPAGRYAYTSSATGPAGASAVASNVTGTANYTIEIVHRDMDYTNADTLIGTILKQIVSGGPRLGFSFVSAVGEIQVQSNPRFDGPPESTDTYPRLVTTLQIPVAMTITGNQFGA